MRRVVTSWLGKRVPAIVSEFLDRFDIKSIGIVLIECALDGAVLVAEMGDVVCH